MNSLLNKDTVPDSKEIFSAISSLPPKQKIFTIFLLVAFCIGLAGIAWNINNLFLVDAAVRGGSLSEGTIGTPRFVNPILATSDTDRDLTLLIFSGLMRTDDTGNLIPDLADSYEVSADGLTYNFKLREGLVWHDGEKFTVDDIIFTVQKIQDPALKSTKRANWEGVRVEKVNEEEIKFILKKPYAGFLDNTTLGILPKHIWRDVSNDNFYLSRYNIEAVGTGPYQITSIKKDSGGVPTYYDLKPFKSFILGEAKIDQIRLYFYSNEESLKEAYRKGTIESLGAIPPDIAKELEAEGAPLLKADLPRIFAAFFNYSQPLFAHPEVRQALNLAIDKQVIIDEVLRGYGQTIDSPLSTGDTTIASSSKDLTAAKALLEKRGWVAGEDGVLVKTDSKSKTKQKLEFILSTTNTPELKATADLLQKQWTALGAKVAVRVYEIGDLDQDVIRPRKFDVLLFGEVNGRNPDPYPFWHSSQRLAPGLNITGYTNSSIDKILEEIRQTTDSKKRTELYAKFEKQIQIDQPAAFIYSPYFLYVLPEKIQGVKLPTIVTRSERFLTVYKWYIHKERIWKIFAS